MKDTQSAGHIAPHHFQELIQAAHCAVVVLDEHHGITYSNPFFQELLKTPTPLVGTSFLTFFPREAQTKVAATLVALRQNHDDREHTFELNHEPGAFTLHFKTLNLETEQGPMLALLGQDMAFHQAEVQLRDGKEYLDSVLDTAIDGIILIDDKGTIISFNKGAENQFGYKASEVVGANVCKLMPQPYMDQHDGYIAQYLNGGRAKIIGKGREVPARRKDGSSFPIFLSVGREITLGNQTCFIGFLKDLSREKRIETQLRQAQKMESIGTLAGGIAHDFNNILGGIMGYVDLMLEDADPGSYLQEDLTEMRNACNRGKDLILQILTFSRQDKTQKIPVQFHPIVKESLKLLRAIIPSNIEIRTHIEENAPAVMADATQIHQIMMNLCTNAYHAMKGESDFIEIVLASLDLDESYTLTQPNLPFGHYVTLSVRDNGTGMDEHTLARLFDPFFTTKSQGKGTGMGLAVVHGIIQNHGGDVVVESRRDRGSTFTLFFPAWELEMEEKLPQLHSRPSGRERIMLVDDDALLLKVQDRILSRRGYEVSTFANGLLALEAFENRPQAFDLVITDQTMPKLTGMELASSLIKQRPDLPIIIATGFSDVITPDKVAARGIRELLRKPVDSEELTKAVRRALDNEEP